MNTVVFLFCGRKRLNPHQKSATWVLKVKMLFAIKIACFKENFSQSFILLLQVVKILLSFPYSFSSTELSGKVLHWALCEKPHCSGGGLCVCTYICMHLCIFSTRASGQLLSRCISTPAWPNGEYSPQVLVKIACKGLRTHFLFPVFLLVRDVLGVLLIVSCTGRDVWTLPRHCKTELLLCSRTQGTTSLRFLHDTRVIEMDREQ